MAKKKILHLITGLELGGGAENMLLHLLPRMQSNELDNQVCVIRGHGGIGKMLEMLNIRVHYLDVRSIFDLGVIFRYRKIVKDFCPDIQVNYLIHADIFGRIFGRIFGIQKIVSYIRNIHRKRKWLMLLDKLTIALPDFILTNSFAARNYYIQFLHIRSKRIECIPNAIDLQEFMCENNISKNRKLRDLGIADGAFVIGCVARLELQKDIATLIRAASLLRGRMGDIQLVIVGHGREERNLRELSENLGIDDRILFLQKRGDMQELYPLMDVFVLPSLNEGMSNALLEAMAMGSLVIVSDIEENQELVKDGVNGFVFRVGEEKELAQKIAYCRENMDTLSRQRSNAVSYVRSRYSLDRVAEQYRNFLVDF